MNPNPEVAASPARAASRHLLILAHGSRRQASNVRSDSLPVAAEPHPERLRNPLKRYFLATRPGFLGVTLMGTLLGLTSGAAGGLDLPIALIALWLALLLHAGVNVLNDYYDHLNGSDAANRQRLFPFTGGSRFIQNGVLTPRQVRAFAHTLFAIVVAGGLALALLRGPGLIGIGLIGLCIGWAYSAPPLRLNSRGLGELGVATGFLGVVIGSDFVQRGAFALEPWLIGLPYALLVTNLLYINQFPDRAADLAAGKRHWVARIDPPRAAWGYVLILVLAIIALLLPALTGRIPTLTLLALLGLLPALPAARQLLRHAEQPERLRPAIRGTLLAAHLTPLILVLTLILAR